VFDAAKLLDGLPTTAALFLLLGAHELGHIQAAKKHGIQLAPPLLIPSNLGFLGSLGAVTRIKSTLKNRTQLLEASDPTLNLRQTLLIVFTSGTFNYTHPGNMRTSLMSNFVHVY
jgi:Zn-dependent protease